MASLYRLIRALARRSLARFGLQLVRLDSSGAPSDPLQLQHRLLEDVSLPVIFDVGAHVGGTLSRYHGLFPGARFFAFEPTPDNCALLRSRVSLLRGAFEIHQIAVCDQLGEARFFANQLSATNSLLPLSERIRDFYPTLGGTVKRYWVPTTTLDAFTSQRELARIDLLKLDVQGSEMLVLQGARDLLEQGRIDLIYLEVSCVEQYQGAPRFLELWQHLDALGYTLFDLDSPDRSPSGRLIQADALFCSPALAARRSL